MVHDLTYDNLMPLLRFLGLQALTISPADPEFSPYQFRQKDRLPNFLEHYERTFGEKILILKAKELETDEE